jgi:hypothetical protein
MTLPSYYPNAVEMGRSLSAIYGSYSITRVRRIKKVFLNRPLHAASFGISCVTFQHSQHSSRYKVLCLHTAGCRFFFYSFYVFRLTPVVMFSLSVR